MRDEAAEFDCVVIGAGPTGAVLAALLGQRGHRVLVVERDTAVYPLPRAVHMDHEIARVLQEIRVLDRMLPNMSPVNEYRFESATGELLLHNVSKPGSATSGWAICSSSPNSSRRYDSASARSLALRRGMDTNVSMPSKVTITSMSASATRVPARSRVYAAIGWSVATARRASCAPGSAPALKISALTSRGS
jgi:choline dehydrogenase-like flavoprotein